MSRRPISHTTRVCVQRFIQVINKTTRISKHSKNSKASITEPLCLESTGNTLIGLCLAHTIHSNVVKVMPLWKHYIVPTHTYAERLTWWRHQMETFSALLAICAGNSPVTVEFPTQRPLTRSFDIFFDLRQNKLLSKQWWGFWFETPSLPLWRHWSVKRIIIWSLVSSEVTLNDMGLCFGTKTQST